MNYSKIVRNDDEPEPYDDGFEEWRDSLTLEQYNQYCADYIDSYRPYVTGKIEGAIATYKTGQYVAVKFDMQSSFQDYLYGSFINVDVRKVNS